MINIKKYLPLFIVYWIANSLLLYLATIVFPTYFTLGNFRFPMFVAAVISGLVWTAITFFAKPIICKFGIKLEGRGLMFFFYWLANFVALWITARFPSYFGFGTSRFIWIAGLAVVADVVQYVIWKVLKMKTK